MEKRGRVRRRLHAGFCLFCLLLGELGGTDLQRTHPRPSQGMTHTSTQAVYMPLYHRRPLTGDSQCFVCEYGGQRLASLHTKDGDTTTPLLSRHPPLFLLHPALEKAGRLASWQTKIRTLHPRSHRGTAWRRCTSPSRFGDENTLCGVPVVVSYEGEGVGAGAGGFWFHADWLSPAVSVFCFGPAWICWI